MLQGIIQNFKLIAIEFSKIFELLNYLLIYFPPSLRSANSIKDNKDEKRQPNSPGRKKAIKKGSPPTEPSSPASPRGRKRKNTGKNGGKL